MIRRLLPDLSKFDPLFRAGPLATGIAVVALALMVVGAIGTIRTGRWFWRAALIGGALGWPFPDHPFQGPILVGLSYHHGIHVADLISVVAVLFAVLPWRRSQLNSSPDRSSAGH